MKQPIAEFIHDSFIDFKGKEHHFVICALSQVLPKKFKDYKESIYIHPCNKTFDDYEAEVYWEINSYIDEYGHDYCDEIVKALSLGIAICNPEDKFDLEIGKKIAFEKAKKTCPCMYVTELGYINTTMVQAFLKQEADYLKDNPGKYIKGYKDSHNKYIQELKEEQVCKSLTEAEKAVALCLGVPGYLDKLLIFQKRWKEQYGD